MMRLMLAVMLLLVPCFAFAEAPAGTLPDALRIESSEVESSEVESSDECDCAGCCEDLEKRVAALERHAWATHDYLKESQMTESRVREIVKEELAAVLGVKLKSGEVEDRKVSVKPTGSTQIQLAPGETIVSIDGVPVRQSAYRDPGASSQSVRYAGQGFEARQVRGRTTIRPLGLARRVFGAGKTCTVNAAGQTVCK